MLSSTPGKEPRRPSSPALTHVNAACFGSVETCHHHQPDPIMNHRHRKVLQAIFAHPVNTNLNFRDVEGVFTELGAEIDNKSGGRIGVTLERP